MVEQLANISTRLPRDKGDGNLPETLEVLPQIVTPLLGRHVFRHQVPFIHHHDARFEMLLDVRQQLLIDFGEALTGVKEHEHDIRMPNAPLGAMSPVPIDVGANTFIFPKTRRVNRHEGLVVHLEADIYTVPGRPCHFRDYHPVAVRQRIDERTLSNVSSTDNRDFHFWFGEFDRIGNHVGKPLNHRFEQVISSQSIRGGNLDRHPITEPRKFLRSDVVFIGIAFVGNQQNGFVCRPQTLADRLIQRCHAIAGIDHEQQQICFLNPKLNLLFNFIRKIVDIIDPNPARIDQLKIVVVFLKQVGHSIPSHARNVIDNRQSATDQPVKKAGLAHVWASDDRDLGKRHSNHSFRI